MSPDDDGSFPGNALLKTTLLTVAFSTVYVYNVYVAHSPFQEPPNQKPVAAFKHPSPQKTPKKKKTIYLSFDDGPNAGTKKLMQVLKQEDLSATLFLIGEHVYGSKLQQEIYESLLQCDNIELANHSYTHACGNNYKFFYSNPDTVVSDFNRCTDSLHFKNNIARTPGRNIWRTASINSTDLKSSTAAADSLQQNNYNVVGWDVEWHFTKDQHLLQSDSAMAVEITQAFEKQTTKTKDALVILAHDNTFASTEDSGQLHNLLKKLKAMNEYEFKKLSSYPALMQ